MKKRLSMITRVELKFTDFLTRCRYRIFTGGDNIGLAFVCLLAFLRGGGAQEGRQRYGLIISTAYPLIYVTAAVIAATVLSFVLVVEAGYGSFVSMMTAAVLVGLSADYFIALAFTMTFATRLKTRTLIKNTVIYKVLKFLLKKLKSLFGFIGLQSQEYSACYKNRGNMRRGDTCSSL